MPRKVSLPGGLRQINPPQKLAIDLFMTRHVGACLFGRCRAACTPVSADSAGVFRALASRLGWAISIGGTLTSSFFLTGWRYRAGHGHHHHRRQSSRGQAPCLLRPSASSTISTRPNPASSDRLHQGDDNLRGIKANSGTQSELERRRAVGRRTVAARRVVVPPQRATSRLMPELPTHGWYGTGAMPVLG
jgi:hypothetical protein